MNDRQRRFVDEYILCPNAAEACRRAGYSNQFANRQAHKLLSKPEIRAAIDGRLAAVSTDKTLDQTRLLEFLSAVVLGEVGDEQLMTRLTGKGTSVIERHETRASLRGRLRAAELLLKVQGAFRERVDVTVDACSQFAAAVEQVWRRVEAEGEGDGTNGLSEPARQNHAT